MDWHFLLIELLLFIAVGWLVFLTLLFYWLIFCGGVVPFSGLTWLVLSADTITDKQAGYFASRLVKDASFQTTFGVGHQSFDTFIDQVTQRLHDPEYFKEYLPWMQKLGFIPARREAA